MLNLSIMGILNHRAIRYGDKKKEKQQANNIQKGFPIEGN
jgi:hypothetical protein